MQRFIRRLGQGNAYGNHTDDLSQGIFALFAHSFPTSFCTMNKHWAELRKACKLKLMGNQNPLSHQSNREGPKREGLMPSFEKKKSTFGYESNAPGTTGGHILSHCRVTNPDVLGAFFDYNHNQVSSSVVSGPSRAEPCPEIFRDVSAEREQKNPRNGQHICIYIYIYI